MTLDNVKRKLEEDGFVVLEGFFTSDECDEMYNESLKLLDNMPDKSQRVIFNPANSEQKQNREKYFLDSSCNISYFFEENSINSEGELIVDPKFALNKIAHGLHIWNPVFKKYTFDERVKETCYQLGYEDPVVVQSMYIFKNPRIGSEVSQHQDATYLYTNPMKLVGFWIALEDATIENGCLWIARGSHKSGVHRRYIRNPNKDSEELVIYNSPSPHYQLSTFKPVPVKKGTCILIDGQVVHFSETNKSDKSRHAYTFHVIERKNSQWSPENWLQYPDNKPFLSVYRN